MRIGYKRYLKNLKRNNIKKRKIAKSHKQYLSNKYAEIEKNLKITKELKSDFSIENTFRKWSPKNINFLFSCNNSDFNLEKLKKIIPDNDGVFIVPENFSIIDNPNYSFLFIRQLSASLIFQKYENIKLDYRECKKIELGTQVFFDVILKEIGEYFDKCNEYTKTKTKVKSLEGININNTDIKKLLFSVGSGAIHTNTTTDFPDIIPYKLCTYDGGNGGSLKNIEQKDIDTTKLVDYVLESLKTLNKELTPDKLDDLSIVIGEILINAEEHSTTKCRFSIGYFHELSDHGKHYGVFRLAILNFGKTIYEKFADEDCPNQEVVKKMKQLSENYTKKGFFKFGTLEEETLWTLYALQEGVTSTNKNRGNGSIQFIESFFNMKDDKNYDDISKMTIISGNTNITFNGLYAITEKEIDGDNFKFMTFNKTGNIEDKPDKKFVKFVDNYFSGTMISAEILFNEGDFTHDN